MLHLAACRGHLHQKLEEAEVETLELQHLDSHPKVDNRQLVDTLQEEHLGSLLEGDTPHQERAAVEDSLADHHNMLDSDLHNGETNNYSA